MPPHVHTNFRISFDASFVILELVSGFQLLGVKYCFHVQCRGYISLICDKSDTTQNLAFLLCYWYRKKRLQMHF